MAPHSELRELLRMALRDSPPVREVGRLVEITRLIVEAYLRKRRASVSEVCTRTGLGLPDLSWDCIGDIFSMITQNRFHRLERFVEKLSPGLDEIPDRNLSIAYRAFVLRVADVHLARSFAQADPFGAHISRNIKDCVRGTKIFCLRRDYRGIALVSNVIDPLDHLPAFPRDWLERTLHSRCRPNDSTMVILNHVAAALNEQNDYRRSIPLIDLIQIVKSLQRHTAHAGTPPEEPSISFDHMTEDDLATLRLIVSEAIKEKIISLYYGKRGMEPEHVRSLLIMMGLIIDDWFEFREERSTFYEYAGRTTWYKTRTKEEYEEFWREKVEYLAKIARKTILEYLEGEL